MGILVDTGSQNVVILCHGCGRRVTPSLPACSTALHPGVACCPPPIPLFAVPAPLHLSPAPPVLPYVILYSFCRYVANYTMCQFPQLAAGLAESGVSSFRFDHAMAIKSESERKRPFEMGNHDDEVGGRAGVQGEGLRQCWEMNSWCSSHFV